MADENFGFIGLGDMGTPMATNAIRFGLPLKVYDLRQEAVDRLLAIGATAAASLDEVLETCDVIGACLSTEAQVRAVFLGPDGLLARGRRGQLFVIHSTIAPQCILEMVEVAAGKGMHIIDCPVSRGGRRDDTGALNLIVGVDDEAVFERARPLIESIAKSVIRADGPGSAQVVKLGNNLMSMCNRIVHMEAIRLVEAYGVPRQVLDTFARHSSGDSRALRNYDDFDNYGANHTQTGPGLPNRLAKDLRTALAAARDKHVHLPAVSLCSELVPEVFAERWASLWKDETT